MFSGFQQGPSGRPGGMRGPKPGAPKGPLGPPPRGPKGAEGALPQGSRRGPWVPLGPPMVLGSPGPPWVLGPWVGPWVPGPPKGPWVPPQGALGFPGPLGPWGHPKIIYLVGALRAPGRRQTRSSNKSDVPCAVVGWRCSAKAVSQ